MWDAVAYIAARCPRVSRLTGPGTDGLWPPSTRGLREGEGWGGKGGKACFAADFFTAAVWCVPFSGAVGLFNKLQTQKKKKIVWRKIALALTDIFSGLSGPFDRHISTSMTFNFSKSSAHHTVP